MLNLKLILPVKCVFYILNFLSFAEMVAAMKSVAQQDTELTVEERNLLSVAYKNVIGARRASWRIISSIEQKDLGKVAEDFQEITRDYRKIVSVKKARRFLCTVFSLC